MTNTQVPALAINSSGHIFAGIWGSDIFRSVDNGDSWTAVVNLGVSYTRVHALAINSMGHIFAANSSDIFRSTNNGDNWTLINISGINPYIEAFAINSSDQIFVATNQGIFQSTDNGDNWTLVNSSLANTFIRAFQFNSNEHIFIGTDDGVFHSSDNCEHLISINSGLTNTKVHSLTINASYYLLAGSFGGGVFRSVQPITSVIKISSDIPMSFSLEQNYPNPFNANTIIPFSLPYSSHTNLKVYNMLGKEVSTLIEKNLSAGNHQIEWNASGIATGVYFYRLHAGTFIQTKKLVVIK